MRGIPPELTTAILTALSIGGAWLATLLSRRGKREDVRITQSNQSFSELKDLAEARRVEIERLNGALAATQLEMERRSGLAEARWDRQMARCRKITEPLVAAVASLLAHRPAAEGDAENAVRMVEQHNQDDHEDSAGF